MALGNRRIMQQYAFLKPIYDTSVLHFEYGYANDCILLDVNDFQIEEEI